MVCVQLIIPLVIYLISFMYISDEHSKWYNDLLFTDQNKILSGSKGLFLGCIVFYFTGVAAMVILDYYYKVVKCENRQQFKGVFINFIQGDSNSGTHFWLFPLMILLSTLGFPIAYQTHTFIPHVIMLIIATIFNVYLMIYYMRRVSYVVSILLIPLLVWQIYNIITYIQGVTTEDKTKTETPIPSTNINPGRDGTKVNNSPFKLSQEELLAHRRNLSSSPRVANNVIPLNPGRDFPQRDVPQSDQPPEDKKQDTVYFGYQPNFQLQDTLHQQDSGLGRPEEPISGRTILMPVSSDRGTFTSPSVSQV